MRLRKTCAAKNELFRFKSFLKRAKVHCYRNKFLQSSSCVNFSTLLEDVSDDNLDEIIDMRDEDDQRSMDGDNISQVRLDFFFTRFFYALSSITLFSAAIYYIAVTVLQSKA